MNIQSTSHEAKMSLAADSNPQSIGLALEVIGREGSIALIRGSEVVQCCRLSADGRAASTLIPAINQLLGRSESGESNVGSNSVGPDSESSNLATSNSVRPDFLAVAIGPGSFTGLRIAVAAAKTLAYAWRIPVVTVDSLSAVARSLEGSPFSETPDACHQRRILVGLTAYRGQVYRGRFEAGLDPDIDLISAEQWQSELAAIAQENGSANAASVGQDSVPPAAIGSESGSSTRNQAWTCTGDRLAFERSGIPLDQIAWMEETEPRALGVGILAIEKFQKGQVTDPVDVVPDYFRPSAAEEKQPAP
ncbi:tRNA (adenosine(37)-N6)-threonylcarbamoyltransferase complex dimerization subunit type 1 TsaB [Neorhodopirellula lusitana]|nr:tRNA (adenosine(37)-N6)-threonylcarbamoyltransferase complex dimerization subunit type 1 TsaB [Neorhodopirellula lusitana]